MNSNQVNPEDLALFAMHLLPAEEAAALDLTLQANGEARTQLAEIQGDLALLALSTVTEAPSAGSLDRLLQRVAHEPRQAPRQAPQTPVALPPVTPEDEQRPMKTGPQLLPATEETPRRNPVIRLLPWLGWAAAAALAVTTAQRTQQRNLLRNDVASVNHQIATLDQQTATARRLLETMQDPSAVRVTLTLSKQRPVPQGRATYNANRGALVFSANNLELLASPKTYELWVIPANGQAPIAAGIFHPDERGNATVLLPRLPIGVAAKAFGVTKQQVLDAVNAVGPMRADVAKYLGKS